MVDLLSSNSTDDVADRTIEADPLVMDVDAPQTTKNEQTPSVDATGFCLYRNNCMGSKLTVQVPNTDDKHFGSIDESEGQQIHETLIKSQYPVETNQLTVRRTIARNMAGATRESSIDICDDDRMNEEQKKEEKG